MTKKKITLLIVSIVVLLIAGLSSYYFFQIKPESIKQTSTSSTAQIKVSLVKTDNATKLYLSNNQTSMKPTISAFQIHLMTSLSPDEYELKINPILQNQNWTFPLVKKEVNELKISGFRMGSAPYEITDTGILFFTLHSNSEKQINIEVAKDNTIFYDNNAQPTVSYTVLNY